MSVTSELVERLGRHYIKPGQDMAGGVFVPEVGLNNGFGQQRRCDAIYVGFTSASGQRMVGHEVKISRADWRHELDQPDKAEVWASQCHAWYVVAPSTDIVPPEELPAGWGLMVPDQRSKNRMKIITRSDDKGPEHQPSWLVLRSVLARLDTLQRSARLGMRDEERRKLSEEFEERRTEDYARSNPKADHAVQTLAKIEELTGLSLDVGWTDHNATPEQFAEAFKIVKARDELTQRYRGLAGNAQELRRLAGQLDGLHELVGSPA